MSWACPRTLSGPSTWMDPAATATTGPMTPPWTRRFWPAPCRDGPCRLNGCGRMKTRGNPMARRRWSRCRPASTMTVRLSTGTTMSSGIPIQGVPTRPETPPSCWLPGIWQSRLRPLNPGPAKPISPGSIETPTRNMPFPDGASLSIIYRTAPCAPLR